MTFQHLAMALGLALLVVSPAAAQTTGDLDALRQRALEAVNADRQENGLPPLIDNEALAEAALKHATDMQQREYYDHVSPEGENVRDRYLAAGGSPWTLVEENIARCTNCETTPDTGAVDRLEEGWMNSPEHRENILREGLTGFGYGIASGLDGRLYAVQSFAGPGTPRGVATADESEVLPPERQTGLMLEAINASRQEAGVAPLAESQALAATARAIIPETSDDDFSLDQLKGLSASLPEASQGDWRQLAMIAAACGGCGTEPTAADLDAFAADWLEGADRSRVLSAEFSDAGLALVASGSGRKVAVLVLGRRQ